MTSPAFREHDEAVVAAVGGVGRQVGLSEAPPGALDALLDAAGAGYYIVYPVPGGSRDGSAADPYADVELVYQITCVDRGPEGARWLADQLEPALSELDVPGRSVMWVTPSVPAGVYEDTETAAQSLFITTPMFRVRTTPS